MQGKLHCKLYIGQELRYISENKIGLTFKSGSSEDLAAKLALFLENKTLRQELGENGRRYASQFLRDDMALRFERFLMEIALPISMRSIQKT